MCIFQDFHFLCGCDKLKISRECHRTSINVQGGVFCQDDPYPHIDDSVERPLDPTAYGPGVCSNIHCRWRFGLLPFGVYGDDSKKSLYENDASFDISEAACAEREDRWYRMLNTDQQLECLSMSFPLPTESMSTYAQAWFKADTMQGVSIVLSEVDVFKPEQLRWYELNPRYMTATQLHHATGFVLPAEVTLPGNVKGSGSTPLKPYAGPFKVGTHVCKPLPGVCRKCGANSGALDFAMRRLCITL